MHNEIEVNIGNRDIILTSSQGVFHPMAVETCSGACVSDQRYSSDSGKESSPSSLSPQRLRCVVVRRPNDEDAMISSKSI